MKHISEIVPKVLQTIKRIKRKQMNQAKKDRGVG